MGQARESALAAEAVRDQAKREWLPKLTVEGTAGVRRLENSSRIAAGLSNRDEYPVYGALLLDQPIFDMGRRGNEVRSQEARMQAARQNNVAVSQALALEASRSFLALMLSQRAAHAANDNVAFHRQFAGQIREGVSRGAMSISEQQQADERLKSAEVRMIDAELDLQQAKINFTSVTGLSTDELVLPVSVGAALPTSLDDTAARVAQNSPRIREAQFAVTAAEAAVRRLKSERGVTVDLSAAARTGTDYDGYRGKTNDYQAVVNVRFPLYEGGVNAARVREADHRAEEARYALVQVQNQNDRDARTAWQRLLTWRMRFDEQTVREKSAQDVLDSYKSQFAIGRRSLLDVLQAQDARYDATVEAETARFGSLLSELTILAATNELTDFFGIDVSKAGQRPYGPQ